MAVPSVSSHFCLLFSFCEFKLFLIKAHKYYHKCIFFPPRHPLTIDYLLSSCDKFLSMFLTILIWMTSFNPILVNFNLIIKKQNKMRTRIRMESNEKSVG